MSHGERYVPLSVVVTVVGGSSFLGRCPAAFLAQARGRPAEVVWAHKLKPEPNRKMIDDFSDRQPWLLEANVQPPRVSPYPTDALPESADPPSPGQGGYTQGGGGR